MYASIRRIVMKSPSAGTREEIRRRTRHEFGRLMTCQPNFVAYYVIDAGNDTLMTVTLFLDRAGADASNEAASNWARNHVAEVQSGPEIVAVGDVLTCI